MKYTFQLLFSILILAGCGRNEKKTSWRGENGNGIFPETGLLSEWPEGGPAEVLCIEGIGNGYGSPAVTGEGIYISGEVDSMAVLFCFSHKGEKVWETEYGEEWTENFPGSRSAPVIIGQEIYIASGKGNLYCMDSRDGSILWSKDFIKDFNGQIPRFGHSETILSDGGRIFWMAGGEKDNVLCLDRFSGETIWSQEALGERSAYNSPMLIELAERKLFVGFSAYHLIGLDAESGEFLWSHEQQSYPPEERKYGMGDTHSNTVLFDNGNIYYIAGDGNGGVKLELSADGREIKEIWRNEEIDGYMGGVVKLGDYLFCDGTRKKDLKAVKASSGEIVDVLKVGSGALVSAENLLYYYNQKGELKLIRFENEKLKEISSFQVEKGSKEHFSHPVIKDGFLYQRHGNALMVYDIRN